MAPQRGILVIEYSSSVFAVYIYCLNACPYFILVKFKIALTGTLFTITFAKAQYTISGTGVDQWGTSLRGSA